MRAHLKSLPDRRAAQGFTMTELLVVIAIIVLLIAIAVPAFSNLLSSSERNLAENQLRAAIAAARDAAIQSDTGDAAAVFLYVVDGNGGHMSIVPCVVAGQIEDKIDPTGQSVTGNLIMRDVLVPIPQIEPMQLPRGWSVRGYAAPLTVFDGAGQMELWYESYDSSGTPAAGRGGWVFPETSFYDPTRTDKGSTRQSFMVRFKVGTGQLDTGSSGTALFFDPVQDSHRATTPVPGFRADQLALPGGTGTGTIPALAPNALTWVKRVLSDRPEFQDSGAAQPNADKRRALLGDASLDTVMVRPVSQLALYQELRMAASIGARGLNEGTGTLYAYEESPGLLVKWPKIDLTLFVTNAATTQDSVEDWINQWIEGHFVPPNAAGQTQPVASDARIFTVNGHLGQLQELVP